MANFEYKKNLPCEHALNLALDSIVIVDDDTWTGGFRPMVSSAVWDKAPAARKLIISMSIYPNACLKDFRYGANLDFGAD